MTSEVKKHSCEDACKHHKGSNKCNCVYCNVFKAPLTKPRNMHKTNQTRNRLRNRLYQKREKINTSVNKEAPEASSVKTKLASITNSSLNSTVKMTGSSKITTVNNNISNKNNNAKVNVKSANVNVPEAITSLPLPQSILTSIESKIKSLKNGHSPNSSIQKALLGSKRSENGSQSLESSKDPSSSSLKFDDSRDINELINFIEGNKSVDKDALTQRKADKKARQRLKKAQERERIENERQLEEEARLKEEKRKEEERLKAEALAKQLIEKQQRKQGLKKSKKKGKRNDNTSTNNAYDKYNPKFIEKTIPAMVTIKRVSEGTNSPATVTITLRGSTPESDDLLLTLLNGHNNNSQEQLAIATINSDRINKSNDLNNDKIDANQKNSKKKKKNLTTKESKELNVTIAVDRNNIGKKKNKKPNKNLKVPDSTNSKVPEIKVNGVKEDINLSIFHLPSGITLTKINGPPTNKNYKTSKNTTLSSIDSKSNKENLVQHSNIVTNTNKKNKKKNKKKQNKKTVESDGTSAEKETSNTPGSSIVTLKNPLFHTLPATRSNQKGANRNMPIFPNNDQASIIRNENGMLTIRSPRLQNPRENGFPISNYLYGTTTPPASVSSSASSATPSVPIPNSSENGEKSSLNAREVLSGLPEIVITKVDKTISKKFPKNKKSLEPDEVSIILISNGTNSTEDQDQEAYNQSCQESVGPKRKVGHLNIKDVIRNNKRDITYA